MYIIHYKQHKQYEMSRLGVSITNDVISSYFKIQNKDILNQHIEAIYEKWGDILQLSLDNLKNKYNEDLIEVVIEKIERKKTKRKIQQVHECEYKKTKEIVIKEGERCCARTWKDPPLIYYDRDESRWILGEQCKKKQKKNQLCGIHLNNLPHGTIYEEPPHTRFEKYKRVWSQKN